MKKYIKWFICCFIFIFLSGCAPAEEEQEVIRAGKVEYSEDMITIGFVQQGKESSWREANTNHFLNTFTEEKGYNLIYINGNSNPERQVRAVYDLIAQKVDYIILSPISDTGWDKVLETAKNANIPVIILERQIKAHSSLYSCWVGSDFEKEGVNAAKTLAEYKKETGKSEEPLEIVLIEGTKGATATKGRTKGLLGEINNHKNWNVVTIKQGDFTEESGKVLMEEVIGKKRKFNVVIAENDSMMFGAMEAMKENGIQYGVKKDVITISFDGVRGAFENMISGKLLASVECNPFFADLVEKVIQKLEEGKTVKAVCFTKEKIFTYKNAPNYLMQRMY